MKILHVLLFCFVSAQHIELIAAKINVFPYAEGTNVSIICSFGSSGGRKFFCRRECKEEDILVKTDEDTSQNGRYSIQYKQGSSKRGFVKVKITQLIKSDSGQYRCGLGGSLVPERYRDFYINVTDASTTSEPNPSTSVPKTSHQSTAPTTSCSSTSVPETSVQSTAVSSYPVYFWPLMVCCLLVSLSAGFLLVIDVWRNRRNSGTNIRGKTDETVMELSIRNENWTPASQQEENDFENL